MEQTNRTHPILIAAGVAVLLFGLLGAAALTGFLPGAVSRSGTPGTLAQKETAPQPQLAAPVQKLAQARSAPPGAPPCPSCGVIESVNAVQVQGDTSGLGAVAGGVAGAVIGNQFGRGDGRTVMTVAGAAGGAYAGNVVEKNMKKQTAYRVTVRMEDGSARSLTQGTMPPFAIGDRVRIVDGKTLERA